jgi:hypothetical protein
MDITSEFQDIMCEALQEAECDRPGRTASEVTLLTSIVDAWHCGLCGKVPDSLNVFRDRVALKNNSEWQEYQRLRAKFSDAA